jgi:hypothetical protein
MKITAWLAGVVSVAAVTAGLSAAGPASAAAAHHATPPKPPGSLAVKGLHRVRGGIPKPGHAILPSVKPGAITYTADWAGYVAVASKNVSLRHVGADFNVPSINCANSPAGSGGPATAGQWVGLDDVSTVEQTGIAGYCDNGTPVYDAWYEMFPPDSPVTYTGTVNAGDAIEAGVYYDSATKKYQLSLDDVTSGHDFTVSAPCPAKGACKNASAEVISEAPHFGPGKGWNLADYGMESFTNGTVTSSTGTKGNLGASKLWGSSEFVMINNSDKVLAYPSPLQGGSAFSTTWLAPS